MTDATRVRAGESELIVGPHTKMTEATGWLPGCVDERTLLDSFLLD